MKITQEQLNAYLNLTLPWRIVISLTAILPIIGVFTVDWKPILASIILIILYIYRDKIDFLELNSVKIKLNESLNEAEAMLKIMRKISDEMEQYWKLSKDILGNDETEMRMEINPSDSYEVLKNKQNILFQNLIDIISEVSVELEREKWLEELKLKMSQHGADFSNMKDITCNDSPFKKYWEHFNIAIPNYGAKNELIAEHMYLLYLQVEQSLKPNDVTLSLKFNNQKNKLLELRENTYYTD